MITAMKGMNSGEAVLLHGPNPRAVGSDRGDMRAKGLIPMLDNAY